LHQYIAAGEVAAFAEVELHQALLHRGSITARPADQPMAVERVGLPLDLVARVDEARGGRGIDDALAVGVVTLDRAELGDEILLAADALARNPRIEEVGTEPHLDRNLRLECNRLLQETFADVAPRAYHVGYDIDRQGCGVTHEKPRVQARTLRLASAR